MARFCDGNLQNLAHSIDVMAAAFRERERQEELAKAWNTAAASKARVGGLTVGRRRILRADYNELRDTYTSLATLAASKGIIRFG